MGRAPTLAVVRRVAVAALCALLAAGCGGGEQRVEPSEWAESVCAALANWRAAMAEVARAGPGPLDAEELERRLERARTVTENLTAQLRGLRPPDVEAAADTRRALADAAFRLERRYDALEQSAREALAAARPAELLQRLAVLAGDFQALVESAARVPQALQSEPLVGAAAQELGRAFAGAQACRTLTRAG